MPKESRISNKARAKVLRELQESEDGLVMSKLNQQLGWRKRETIKVVDDLLTSGMVEGERVANWVKSHNRGTLLEGIPWMYQVTSKGLGFLKHWDQLEMLSSTEPSVEIRKPRFTY